MLCCLSVAVEAGSFKVLPLGLTLGPGRQSATLRLINSGGESVTVQLEAMAWTQDEEGRDRYRATDDLLFFPRLVTLSAGEEAVVRVAYRGPPVRERERSYRLYAQEIPLPEAGRLHMALRIGVPVFVTPPHARPRWRLQRAERSADGVRIWVENSGDAHVLLGRIYLRSHAGGRVGERGGWYVLPGSRRTFGVTLSPGDCREGESLEVVVETAGRSERRALEAPTCPGDGKTEGRISR